MAWQKLLVAVIAVALISVGLVVVLPQVGDTASELEPDEGEDESDVTVTEGETITEQIRGVDEGESDTLEDAGVVVSVESIDGDVVTVSVEDVEEGEVLMESTEAEVGETVEQEVDSTRFTSVSVSVNSLGDDGATMTVSVTETDEVISVGSEGTLIATMAEIVVPVLGVLGLSAIIIRLIVSR